MTKEEILVKLKDIFKLVVHNGVEVDHLDASANITLDLGVNSVALIYLVLAIEKTFNVEMRDVTYSSFKTVGEVVDYIYERVK
ncbi:MAG: hypothetical protein J1F65_04285 [Clostridiales bacterium]|nr:hypothetical protein [Clostridiales bacterium]